MHPWWPPQVVVLVPCVISSKPIQVNITLVTLGSSTACYGLILSLLVVGEVSNATIDKAYSKSMYSLSISKHRGIKYQILCFLKVSTIMLWMLIVANWQLGGGLRVCEKNTRREDSRYMWKLSKIWGRFHHFSLDLWVI